MFDTHHDLPQKGQATRSAYSLIANVYTVERLFSAIIRSMQIEPRNSFLKRCIGFVFVTATLACAFQPPTANRISHYNRRQLVVRSPSPFVIRVKLSESFLEFDSFDEDFDETVVQSPKEISPRQLSTTATTQDETSKKVQYAALAPGTVIQIQVGDISLARKAWKKRRRSGSPLLVPCSVINVDRQSTVRWNLIYLLLKFGHSCASGIQISLQELSQRHRTHLKASLSRHAFALGHDSVYALVMDLFNRKAQETYGVKVVPEDEDQLWLEASLSRFKAQKRAQLTPILQFSDLGTDDTLSHTGIVRNRQEEQTSEKGNEDEQKSNFYRLQMLSAALRVQQEDVDNGTVQTGSRHPAVVFDYDTAGDAGAPLLTLSLNPSRNQVRERLKLGENKHRVISNPKYMLKDLKAGDGPLQGKVVRLIKGGALVDCGIGRSRNDEIIQVLGFLKFRDAVMDSDSVRSVQVGVDLEMEQREDDDDDDDDWDEALTIDDLDTIDDEDEDDEDWDEDEQDEVVEDFDLASLDNDDEESEDITHLFKMDENGNLVYSDPETGETQIISMEDDDEDDDTTHSLDETQAIESTGRNSTPTQQQFKMSNPSQSEKGKGRRKTKTLYIGDVVDLYVKSVSKQSSQILFSMDSALRGKRAKEIKHESEVDKKLSRLATQLGGFHRIEELRGHEMEGVVMATSNTGDWLYVHPKEHGLPVGVATISPNMNGDIGKGDEVVIAVEGIDERRGQLALRILRKANA